eukprot:gene12638-26618_t
MTSVNFLTNTYDYSASGKDSRSMTTAQQLAAVLREEDEYEKSLRPRLQKLAFVNKLMPKPPCIMLSPNKERILSKILKIAEKSDRLMNKCLGNMVDDKTGRSKATFELYDEKTGLFNMNIDIHRDERKAWKEAKAKAENLIREEQKFETRLRVLQDTKLGKGVIYPVSGPLPIPSPVKRRPITQTSSRPANEDRFPRLGGKSQCQYSASSRSRGSEGLFFQSEGLQRDGIPHHDGRRPSGQHEVPTPSLWECETQLDASAVREITDINVKKLRSTPSLSLTNNEYGDDEFEDEYEYDYEEDYEQEEEEDIDNGDEDDDNGRGDIFLYLVTEDLIQHRGYDSDSDVNDIIKEEI